MNLLVLPSRFFTPGRRLPIRYIVLHTTEGTDSRAWLTQTGNVSAHYLVRGLDAYLLVPEGDVAWHAGVVSGEPTTPLYRGVWDVGSGWTVNPNEESIGIEIEGRAGSRLPLEAIETAAQLVVAIRRRRREELPIVAHAELSPARRTDPGIGNMGAIAETIGRLEGDMYTEEDRERARRIDARLDELARVLPSIWLQRLFYRLNPWTGKPAAEAERAPAYTAAPAGWTDPL